MFREKRFPTENYVQDYSIAWKKKEMRCHECTDNAFSAMLFQCRYVHFHFHEAIGYSVKPLNHPFFRASFVGLSRSLCSSHSIVFPLAVPPGKGAHAKFTSRRTIVCGSFGENSIERKSGQIILHSSHSCSNIFACRSVK